MTPGVDLICLCDTNGGRLPYEIEDAIQAAIAAVVRVRWEFIAIMIPK